MNISHVCSILNTLIRNNVLPDRFFETAKPVLDEWAKNHNTIHEQMQVDPDVMHKYLSLVLQCVGCVPCVMAHGKTLVYHNHNLPDDHLAPELDRTWLLIRQLGKGEQFEMKWIKNVKGIHSRNIESTAIKATTHSNCTCTALDGEVVLKIGSDEDTESESSYASTAVFPLKIATTVDLPGQADLATTGSDTTESESVSAETWVPGKPLTLHRVTPVGRSDSIQMDGIPDSSRPRFPGRDEQTTASTPTRLIQGPGYTNHPGGFASAHHGVNQAMSSEQSDSEQSDTVARRMSPSGVANRYTIHGRGGYMMDPGDNSIVPGRMETNPADPRHIHTRRMPGHVTDRMRVKAQEAKARWQARLNRRLYESTDASEKNTAHERHGTPSFAKESWYTDALTTPPGSPRQEPGRKTWPRPWRVVQDNDRRYPPHPQGAASLPTHADRKEWVNLPRRRLGESGKSTNSSPVGMSAAGDRHTPTQRISHSGFPIRGQLRMPARSSPLGPHEETPAMNRGHSAPSLLRSTGPPWLVRGHASSPALSRGDRTPRSMVQRSKPY